VTFTPNTVEINTHDDRQQDFETPATRQIGGSYSPENDLMLPVDSIKSPCRSSGPQQEAGFIQEEQSVSLDGDNIIISCKGCDSGNSSLYLRYMRNQIGETVQKSTYDSTAGADLRRKILASTDTPFESVTLATDDVSPVCAEAEAFVI
jgi:hypothetical protein